MFPRSCGCPWIAEVSKAGLDGAGGSLGQGKVALPYQMSFKAPSNPNQSGFCDSHPSLIKNDQYLKLQHFKYNPNDPILNHAQTIPF